MTADIDAGFFAAGGCARGRLRARGRRARAASTGVTSASDAPIARPGKIVCVGLNYRDHAVETGAELPAEPVLFLKDPSTHRRPVRRRAHPARIDQDRLGGGARRRDRLDRALPRHRARRPRSSPGTSSATTSRSASSSSSAAASGTRARAARRSTRSARGSSRPTRCADPQAPRPAALGQRRARARTARRPTWSSGSHHLVWYISQFMVLRPGDLINTGTPAGVALG